jgi:hypothetical protein
MCQLYMAENPRHAILLAMPVAVVSRYAPSKMQKRNKPHLSRILCLAHLDIVRLSFPGGLLCILLVGILLRLCRSIRLLNIKSSLGLCMLLAELLLLDEQTYDQSERGKAHIHDPHRMQALCKCCLSNMLLRWGKTVDEFGVGSSTASCKFCCDFWAECCYKAGCLCVHLILVYDLADDNGDGCENLADEAEGCSRCGNVSGLDVGLQCDQGSLEVGA